MSLTLPQAKALWKQRFQDLIDRDYWVGHQAEVEQFAEDWWNCQVLPPVDGVLNWTETATVMKVVSTLDDASDLLGLADLSSAVQVINVSSLGTLSLTEVADFGQLQLSASAEDTLVLTEAGTTNIALCKVADDNLGLVETALLQHLFLEPTDDNLNLSEIVASSQTICEGVGDTLNLSEMIDGESIDDERIPWIYRLDEDDGAIIFYPSGT
jgi:hypothetical protein